MIDLIQTFAKLSKELCAGVNVDPGKLHKLLQSASAMSPAFKVSWLSSIYVQFCLGSFLLFSVLSILYSYEFQLFPFFMSFAHSF